MAARGTVLVTGATGNVGRSLVEQLADSGTDVRALVRDPSAAAFPTGVEVARGDLSDPASLEPPLVGVSAVFLLWPFLDADGADAVLDVVRRHADRVVYLSAYGVDLRRDREANPILQFHADLERAVERTGLEWVILRPTSFAWQQPGVGRAGRDRGGAGSGGLRGEIGDPRGGHRGRRGGCPHRRLAGGHQT